MSLTKIGSIGINTGIQLAGVTTVTTLHVGSGVTLSSDGDVFATGISTFSEDIKVGSGITLSPDGDGFYTGVVTATTFSGALSGSGANISDINASNIASGTVPTARLGSGTASSSTFLRGDSSFQTITTDLVGDTTPQLGGNLDSNGNNIKLGDSSSSNDDRLQLGAATNGDLEIFHDGSSSYMDNATGDLYMRNSSGQILIRANTDAYISNYAANEHRAAFKNNGAVELYHDGTKKIETASYGVLSAGQVRVSASNATTVAFSVGDEGTGFYNTGSNAIGYATQGTQKWNINSSGNLRFNDSVATVFGTGNDLLIYHDGSHSYIDNSTGSLKIRDTGGVTKISVYGSGTVFSNTTDDAAMNDCILLTRRGYEFSGYGTKIQAMGGSSDSQNGIRFAHSHSNGGGYTVRQRFDHDGIKFNGDTAAANGLDDYEEGTWTPTISFTGSTNVSYSGSSRNAEYVKVGKLVYIRGFVSASGTGTNSGQIKIGGLPFTPNSGGYGRHAISMQSSGFALGSGNAGLFGLIEESAAQIDIYGGNASGTAINISGSQWNSAGMYFAGTYHVLGY